MATPYYNVFTGKTSIPAAFLLQGTITTVGTKVTLLNGKNQLLVGDFIYDISQNELRKVISFQGNNPILDSAFTVDISSPIELYVAGRTLFKSLSITCAATADGYLNGKVLSKRSIVNYSDPSGLTPVSIDGSGTSISISGL